MKNYQKIAQILTTINNCKKNNNTKWQEKWEQELEDLLCACPIELKDAELNGGKLILELGFFALDNNGGVIGYISPKLTVYPDVCWGFDVQIRGWKTWEKRNKAYGLVQYLEDTVHDYLNQTV